MKSRRPRRPMAEFAVIPKTECPSCPDAGITLKWGYYFLLAFNLLLVLANSILPDSFTFRLNWTQTFVNGSAVALLAFLFKVILVSGHQQTMLLVVLCRISFDFGLRPNSCKLCYWLWSAGYSVTLGFDQIHTRDCCIKALDLSLLCRATHQLTSS